MRDASTHTPNGLCGGGGGETVFACSNGIDYYMYAVGVFVCVYAVVVETTVARACCVTRGLDDGFGIQVLC